MVGFSSCPLRGDGVSWGRVWLCGRVYEDEWLALSFLSSAAPPNSLFRLRPLALALPAAPICDNKLQVALFARLRSKSTKTRPIYLLQPEFRLEFVRTLRHI